MLVAIVAVSVVCGLVLLYGVQLVAWRRALDLISCRCQSLLRRGHLDRWPFLVVPFVGRTGWRSLGAGRRRDVIYADYAGCPPVSPSLLRACLDDLEVRIARDGVPRNPHSERGNGVSSCSRGAPVSRQRSGAACLDALREKTLQACGASGKDYICVITSGATAGCKLVGEAYFHEGKGGICRDDLADSAHGVQDERNEFAYLVDNHTSVVGIQGIGGMRVRSIEVADLLGKADDSGGDRQRGQTASVHMSHDTRNKDGGKKLFAFPSESNFTGARYSLDAIEHWKKRGYRVLLDAAKSFASQRLDLSRYKPDFVVLSYYKLFGNPTGLGALLVRRDAAGELDAGIGDAETTNASISHGIDVFDVQRRASGYFGGGTVAYAVPELGVVRRKRLPHRFEHGTLSYLGVTQALVGFAWFEREFGRGDVIDARAVGVAMALSRRLLELTHHNGRPVCKVYGSWPILLEKSRNDENIQAVQGPVVAFNIMDHHGRVLGCRDVERAADMEGIALRSGSLCNPGGLRVALGLSVDKMLDVWRELDAMRGADNGNPSAYPCDEGVVMPDGTPTGVLRASFGYASVVHDAERIADFVSKTFRVGRDHIGKTGTKIGHLSLHKHRLVRVRSMFIYPIKSCQPQRVASWEIDASHSLAYDRHWKLVQDTGAPLTVKRCPLLSRVAPSIDLDRRVLRIKMTDGESSSSDLGYVEVPLNSDDAMTVSASSWLSNKLGVSCSLVRANQERNFSNQSHTLVMYAPTIERIRSTSGSRASFDEFALRMRPNMIFEGVDSEESEKGAENEASSAFAAEDGWKELVSRVHHTMKPAIRATAVKPCTRCDRTCIDPKTGLPDKEETSVLRSIIAAKRGTGSSLLTLGVLMDFSPCLLSEGLVFSSISQ